MRLIDPAADVRIRSSKLLIFPSALSGEEMARVKHYCINAVESREKNLELLTERGGRGEARAGARRVSAMADDELAAYRKRQGWR